MNKFAPLIAFLATFLFTARTVMFDFVGWDDDRYIHNNPIKDAPLADCLAWAFGGVQFQSYHPIHHGLLCAEMSAFDSATGYHVVSVLLFAVLASLLAAWLIAEKVGAPAALLTALIFVLHPFNVETVASIISQKDLLGLSFGVAALWVRASRPDSTANRVIEVALIIGAALSKSGYAMFAFVLIARDWCIAALDGRAIVRRNAVATCIAIGILGAAVYIVTSAQLPASNTPWFNARIIGATITHYVLHLFVPLELVAVHCIALTGPRAIAGFVAVLLVGGAIAAKTRMRGWAGFGFITAVVGMAPYLNAIPVPLGATNRFATMLVFGAAIGLTGLFAIRATRIAGAVVAIGLASLSLQHQPMWQDSLSLWKRTAAVSPCMALPFTNLSVARFTAGDQSGAEDALFVAVALEPDNEKLYRDIVLAFLLSGDCEPPVAPLDAQRFYADIPAMPNPLVVAAKNKWLASAIILSLRQRRDKAGRVPAPVKGLLTNVRKCNDKRADRIQKLFDLQEKR